MPMLPGGVFQKILLNIYFIFFCLSVVNITSLGGLHTCQRPKDFIQSQALRVISQLATGRHLVPNILSFDRKRILSLTPACPSDWKLLLTSIQIYSDSWRGLRLLVLPPWCYGQTTQCMLQKTLANGRASCGFALKKPCE